MNFQKNIDHNESDHAEGAIAPKLVFSDDAMVVDYLNALLASAPANNTDSAEIHFVHLANGAEWKPVGAENGYVGSVISYETEFSKKETQELRRENEHLKFKNELAEIDSQVLRGENDNLKSEIAVQAKQLNELKGYLGEILNQNVAFKTMIEQLQNELDDLSKINKMVVPPPKDTASAANDYKVIEKEIESDIASTSDKILPEPIVIPQPIKMNDKTLSGIDEDTAMISHQQVVIDTSPQNASPDTIIFSRQQAAIITPSLTTRVDSRILKQDEIKESQSRQETGELEKKYSLNPVRQENLNVESVSTFETTLNQDAAKPQAPEGVEAEQGESSSLNTVSLNRDSVDEIDMETAPDPKIVVRRNVKLYQDIQKVTDSTNAVNEGHGIVL